MDQPTYTLMSSLRGPDLRNPGLKVLKEELTARLRHVAEVEEYGPLSCSTPFDEEALTRIRQALQAIPDWVESILSAQPEIGESIARAVIHYLDHTIEAVLNSQFHPVWNDYAPTIIDVIGDCTEKLLLAIHAYLTLGGGVA